MNCGPYWPPYADWPDANLDSVFTVSDLLPAIGRILATPGIVIARAIVEGEPKLAQFLEISCTTTSGGLVTFFAISAWLGFGACVFYILAKLHVVLSATQAVANGTQATIGKAKSTIQVDQPINSAKEDLFDRRGFAARIGEVIAARSDSSALVIGIYGPWGDGKTSTLRMIREAIAVHQDICTIDYNPWQFGDNRDAIVRSFWKMLDEVINESFVDSDKAKSAAAEIAKMIPYVGESLSGAIRQYSTKSINEARRQIAALLEHSEKRIVVFIDDIDRLERDEIQTLFRLVRLSADFPKIVYVLAFDDEIVSSALGEVYGDGAAEAGRRFLEKIIQVPLHLPPADKSALQAILFESCERVLDDAGISIDKAEGERIGSAIVAGFSELVRTPRQTKLFDNAISFSVPVLKGEVNAGDQILIEGIRVFMPSLYLHIRENQKAFLSDRASLGDKEIQKRDDAIKAILSKIPLSEEQSVSVRHHLLEVMFPRISEFSSEPSASSEWARKRSICSNDHFRRYFVYGIPKGDYADAEIDIVISNAAAGHDVIAAFREALDRKTFEIFIRKLRFCHDRIPPSAIGKILHALREISADIPITDSFFVGDFEFRNAAILASDLVKRLAREDQDWELIQLVENASSILYPVEVMRWSEVADEGGDRKGWLDRDRTAQVFRQITQRLATMVAQGQILFGIGGKIGRILGGIRHSLAQYEIVDLREAMKEWLTSNPAHASDLFRECTPIAHSGRGSRISDFSQTGYDSISFFVDGNLVIEQLKKQFGSRVETDTYDQDFAEPEGSVELRLARQFFYLHTHRKSKPNQEALQ